MRYRKLDENGDYSFGRGQGDFLIDSPACVGQSVVTRLRLLKGEWFLDVTEGTPWSTDILGEGTKTLYDLAIRQRVLQTAGVTQILEYESALDPDQRKLSVKLTIDTVFGEAPVQVTL